MKIKKMMEKLIEYIELIEEESFIGWSEDEIKGYLTASYSIKEKAKEIIKNE